jgi:hypothetical protein
MANLCYRITVFTMMPAFGQTPVRCRGDTVERAWESNRFMNRLHALSASIPYIE